ncbi:MAG: PIN domain-containing protein [Patescibacteria group bacterium]
MKKSLDILDTNILIRFLTNDTPEQAAVIEGFFKKAAPKTLIVPDMVVAEVIFVLLSFYDLSKAEVVDKLQALVSYEKFKINRILMQKALDVFSSNSISFVDAYLVALASAQGPGVLRTFDKRLLKLNGVTVSKPE